MGVPRVRGPVRASGRRCPQRVLIIDDADTWERRLVPGTPARLKDLAQRWDATIIALCHFGHDRPILRKHPRDEWAHWERFLDATVILDRPRLHNPLNVRIAEMGTYAWSTRAPMMQETFVFQGHICSVAGPFPLRP